MKTIRSALQEIQAIEIYHNIPITALAVDNNASKNLNIAWEDLFFAPRHETDLPHQPRREQTFTAFQWKDNLGRASA